MGSGKSTTARFLSKITQIPYLDLDEVIEKEQGKSVQQLFKDEGEIKFRRLEHEALAALLASEGEFVLALGGGTPVYANNHLLLQRDDVASFYLRTGINEVIRRVQAQGTVRPLLAGREGKELEEFIGQHIFERSYFYNHAKYTVLTDGKLPEEVAADIAALL